jgi:hypothetical protein
MKQWRVAVSLAIGCFSHPAGAAPPVPVSSCAAAARSYLTLQIDGGVPGLTRDQLRSQLLRKMAADGLGAAACDVGAGLGASAGRIVWSLRSLPRAAGTVRYQGPGSSGAVIPATISRHLDIEAHLTIHGIESCAAGGMASVNGYDAGATIDPVLSEIVRRLVNDLQNKKPAGQ